MFSPVRDRRKGEEVVHLQDQLGFVQVHQDGDAEQSSPSECHRRVRTVLQGCEGVVQIKDDVLVFGTESQHEGHLSAVLERFQEAGLTLRKDKCKLGKDEGMWFGHLYSRFSVATYGPKWPDLVRIWTFLGKLVQNRSKLVTKSLIFTKIDIFNYSSCRRV